ncbi:hypothetical protein AST20_10165 [Acinetobacter baumannii]|nr:hypothetical protein [Acinetobacter baumannii]OUM77970.1 hypothetical protein AST20_10165 [Acinetobacter baumannii]
MTHLNELYLILNKYLKWNKSHLKCFALIMLVIILKQTCNLSSASKALPIKCLPQSFYRRMQRFFAGQYFDYRQISHQKKVIKIKKHGRLSMSLFRYGLDYVQMAIQRLIGFGKKEEFKEILAILRRQNPDRIRVL